jgi:hypothetical protein
METSEESSASGAKNIDNIIDKVGIVEKLN